MRPAAAFARLGLLSVVVTGVALAIGYFPTRALAGPDGTKAMLAGVGIALSATLVGLVPVLVMFGHGPRSQLTGMLTGMALRLILTVGPLIFVLLSGWLNPVALAVWVVIAYLVLVSVDTLGVVRLIRRSAGRPS